MPKATLEIHQINVGQGDATLVIVRDTAALAGAVTDVNVRTGDAMAHLPWCLARKIPLSGTVLTALLIDGGNDCYGESLREHLESVGAIDPAAVLQRNLFIMANHFHDDHQDGLRSILRRWNDDGDALIERYRPRAYLRMASNRARDETAGSWTTTLIDDLASQTAPDETQQCIIPPGGRKNDGSRMTVELGSLSTSAGLRVPITLKILASDQAYFIDGQPLRWIPPKGRARPSVAPAGAQRRPVGGKGQNDRSIALVIEFGAFRHFIGGDIGGPDCPDADVETPLSTALPRLLPASARAPSQPVAGHCCSMKMSHHGSKYSNTAPILAALTPRVVVGSAGVRQHCFLHPTQETITRLLTDADWGGVANTVAPRLRQAGAGGAAGPDGVFVTEMASKGRVGAGKVVDHAPNPPFPILGSIIIRPTDESVLAAHGTAPGAAAPVTIQVYGDGSQTDPALLSANYSLTAVRAVADPIYPIAPVDLVCRQHGG